jgi:hypothetical protein
MVVVTDEPCATVTGPAFESERCRELLDRPGSVNEDVSCVTEVAASFEGEVPDKFPEASFEVAGAL